MTIRILRLALTQQFIEIIATFASRIHRLISTKTCGENPDSCPIKSKNFSIFHFLSAQFPDLIFRFSNFSFILKSLFKPISDYLLKPFLVSLHNWLCVPLCGLSYHVCILCTHTISPCFRIVTVTCYCSRKMDGRTSSPLSYWNKVNKVIPVIH